MNYIKSSLVLIVSFLTLAATVHAQKGQGKGRPAPMMKQKTVNPDSISDDELRTFAKGMQKARKIRMQTQADVKKIVEKHGLSFKRFQQIMLSKRSKKMKGKINVTKEEKAKMDTLQPKIRSAQQNARKRIMKAIQKSDLTLERFKQIGRALRRSKKLQKRFKKIRKQMMQKQKQNAPQSSDTTGN